MDPVRKLLAIEEIKKTKATYWYTLDTKDWQGFGDCFTEDCVFDMRPEALFAEKKPVPELPPVEEALVAGDPNVTKGGRAFAEMISVALADWRTVHHGHAPIIDILSEDEGKAIWPLFDYIDNGRRCLMAYGHYHETYRRQPDGRWLIGSLLLTRLRGDGEHPMLG